MDNGFQFFDILFFAMVAVFLIFRLYSVLGKKTGHEKERYDIFNELEQEVANEQSGFSDDFENFVDDDVDESHLIPENGKKVFDDIQKLDPYFKMYNFIDGAQKAFEIIITSFASGDKETLKNLLDDSVYKEFIKAIDIREKAKQTQETTLVSIRDAQVKKINLRNKIAKIEVLFKTEQINVIKDEETRIIDGDPNYIETLQDIWVFKKDVSTQDPVWKLTKTMVIQDEEEADKTDQKA